jgi:hypothetical protein
MNKLISRVTLLLAAAAAVLLLAWMPGNDMKAKAGTGTGEFTVTGEDSNYSFSGGTLTITGSGPVTISNTNPSLSTENTIVVNSSQGANITLNGVNIDVSRTEHKCAFQIASGSGDVTVTLNGNNVLKSGCYSAGLQKGTDDKTLTIKGIGSLKATGGWGGAGIGGGAYGGNGSYITICSGTVIATGGLEAAGIGAGYHTYGDRITIKGGNVTATGDNGAGIGSGRSYGSSTDIKIAPASGSIAVEEGDSAGNISKRYTCTYPATYSYDSQQYGTPTYIHTEPTDVDLGSTASSGSGSGSPCTHDYEWTVYSEATPTEDGKWALQCTKCGDIKAWQPISAYGAFNIAAYDKIKAAKAGSSVTVETPIFNSFTKAVMDEIITRKDVTVNVRYYAKGHEHQQFSIPAGTDLGKLADVKYYGFEYLKGIAPATVQKIR